ncbi:hypothetical protein EYF80_017688 [Liparis tanakae]|uniref:Uncharacterized protein n=1 Tax=Liparis tanakae TaxID=230148 RepID=A0A4Z2I2W4_9TELE|nr:hypothetical protein EYF80_017688 [Liparis tanakae]
MGCVGLGNQPDRLATSRAAPMEPWMSLMDDAEIWESGSSPDSMPCSSEQALDVAFARRTNICDRHGGGRTALMEKTATTTGTLVYFNCSRNHFKDPLRRLLRFYPAPADRSTPADDSSCFNTSERNGLETCPTRAGANILPDRTRSLDVSPPGSPSHTSSQSYLQSPSPPGKGSFSRSKVRKVRVTSMLEGTMMMKEHSRLWGYLSGKPGDSMSPVGLIPPLYRLLRKALFWGVAKLRETQPAQCGLGQRENMTLHSPSQLLPSDRQRQRQRCRGIWEGLLLRKLHPAQPDAEQVVVAPSTPVVGQQQVVLP